MKAGVIGASGYAGGELLRILSRHPYFKIEYVAAGSNSQELISDLHPHLTGFDNQRFSTTSLTEINKCDLLFVALPHGESSRLVNQVADRVKIVDLGADFRLQDAELWQKYYGGTYAGSWTYGLPELVDHEKIAKSSRVSNPGCYATAIALATAPALNFIDVCDISIVASSGTTGAGRGAKVNLPGSEFKNNLTTYKFGGVHQHTPEIEQILQTMCGKKVKISFTPVLAPIPRGILATVTARVTSPTNIKSLRDSFTRFYNKSKFIEILPETSMPETLSVLETNNAQIQVAFDEHVDRVLVSIAIDNLGKGAAGQAVQNANLMCAISEDAGLFSKGQK